MRHCGSSARTNSSRRGCWTVAANCPAASTAYQAKAARLGLGEDSDLLACGRIAAGLLSRQPCDLRAVTRAISDFQQMIAQKGENQT